MTPGDTLAHICSSIDDNWCFVLDDLLALWCLYDSIYASANWVCWVRNMVSDFYMRISGCGVF